MNLFFAFLPENGKTISSPSSFVFAFSPAILLLFSEVLGSAMIQIYRSVAPIRKVLLDFAIEIVTILLGIMIVNLEDVFPEVDV